MKKLIQLIPVILIVFIASCGDKKAAATEEATTVVQEEVAAATEIFNDVDIAEFKALISGNGILVDVRTPEEFAQGNIEGAANIDFLNSDFETKIQELDKSTPIYLYCRSGNRSGQSMKKMKALGFTEVYNLMGGYKAWSAQ